MIAGGAFIESDAVLLECPELDDVSTATGSLNAFNISPLINGNVSSENDNASSSAYTSNNLGRLSSPSVNRCIVSLGESENVGTETALVAFPPALRLDLDVDSGVEDHIGSDAYVERRFRRGESITSCNAT